MPLNWETSPEDVDLIGKIVERAKAIFQDSETAVDTLSLTMSIEAVHCNGCPMKLQEWLDAPQYDFMHDVSGIMRHVDPTTGKLNDYFWPRYAQTQS